MMCWQWLGPAQPPYTCTLRKPPSSNYLLVLKVLKLTNTVPNYQLSPRMSIDTHHSLRQADPSHRICLFGPQYCFPTPFQIILREKFFRLREDCFKITDAQGNLFFQVTIQWCQN